jgi:hypothetical protein
VSSNPVSLSWVAGLGGAPADYVVHVGSTSGSSDILIRSVGLSTSVTSPAPERMPLFVRVVAVNAHGSAASNEVVVLVGGVTPPGAPTLSGQTTVNPVTLQWAPGPGGAPAAYTLLVGTSANAANVGSFPMGLATTISASAPAGLPLFVRVVAQNAAGVAASNELSFAVLPQSGGLLLHPPIVSGSTVHLAWSGLDAAASYTLHARGAPNGPILISASLGAMTSLSVPVAPDGAYYVTVVASFEGRTVTSNAVTVVVSPTRR